MKPEPKAPGSLLLKLRYDGALSILLQICFQMQLAALHHGHARPCARVPRHVRSGRQLGKALNVCIWVGGYVSEVAGIWANRIQPFTESSEFSNQAKCSYIEKYSALRGSANHPESGRIRPFTESSEFSNRQPRFASSVSVDGRLLHLPHPRSGLVRMTIHFGTIVLPNIAPLGLVV
jgi:hypothetical protein